MRLVLILFVLFISPLPALAKIQFFSLGDKVTPSSLAGPKTVPDFANIYYANCATAAAGPLKNYLKSQCACAAATMSGALNLDQTRKLFEAAPGDRKGPYARFIMLAYVPCLETTVRDMTYDQCLEQAGAKKLKRPLDMCACYADGMKDYIRQTGANTLPGFDGTGYDLDKAEDNPLPDILNLDTYRDADSHYMENCFRNVEMGWDKRK